MEHCLKIWPVFFQAKAQGVKSWELRKNDRGFKVGDTVNFQEWDQNNLQYTGRTLTAKITAVFSNSSNMDTVIFSDDSHERRVEFEIPSRQYENVYYHNPD